MMIQGSPEWFAARCGRVTASRVADLIAKTKTGYSTSRANYMAELICERLTGSTAPSFTNAAMQWGTDQEPFARSAYMQAVSADVFEVGFVAHPEIDMSGASPDGLVGAVGMLEIKCPNTATHLDTLLSETIQAKYITQMQWQMACTGRQWCDFVSFDPRLPPEMQTFIRRVERDVSTILDLESEVSTFIAELETKLDQLSSKYQQKDAA